MDFDFTKHVDLAKLGDVVFDNCQRLEKPKFTVKIVDVVKDYTELLETLFDFELLRKLFSRPGIEYVSIV